MSPAILSIMLSVLGLIGCPPFAGIAGIWLGKKAQREGDQPQLAHAGIILGWISLASNIVGLCIVAVLLAAFLIPAPEAGTEIAPTPSPQAEWATPLPANPALGITCEDAGGAKVSFVFAGTPAEKAGLQEGDIITFVDGMYVGYCDDLEREIASHRPGERILLTVLRDGKNIRIAVVLGTTPSE